MKRLLEGALLIPEVEGDKQLLPARRFFGAAWSPPSNVYFSKTLAVHGPEYQAAEMLSQHNNGQWQPSTGARVTIKVLL